MAYNNRMPDGSWYKQSQWSKKDYKELARTVRDLSLILFLNNLRDKRIQRALLNNRANRDIYDILYTTSVVDLPILIGDSEIKDKIINFRLTKGR